MQRWRAANLLVAKPPTFVQLERLQWLPRRLGFLHNKQHNRTPTTTRTTKTTKSAVAATTTTTATNTEVVTTGRAVKEAATATPTKTRLI